MDCATALARRCPADADPTAPHLSAPLQAAELIIVVVLQAAQTIAALYLPSLNADIIDKGVLTGDTALHLVDRRRDAARHAAAGRVRSDGACTSEPRPRWASVAMCAAASSIRSSDFSAREVGQFGAPSLITRITNDVQQVQMLVLMTCTLLVAAPITASAASSWRCARTSGCRGS